MAAPATVLGTRTGRRAAADGGIVTAATVASNVAGYALLLGGAALLTPGPYGVLAALLGAGVVAAVPALAVQWVAARHAALHAEGIADGIADGTAPLDARLLRLGAGVGLATGALLAIGSPLVALALRLDGLVPALALAAATAPLGPLHAVLGLLQGRRRFVPLAWLLTAGPVGRAVGGLLALVVTGSPTGALLGTAAGQLIAAGLGVVVLRRGTGRREPTTDDSRVLAPAGSGALVREVLVAAAGVGGLLVLANMDLLLARSSLSATDAGTYALGAVVAKVALWGPQVVTVLAVPRLAGPQRAAALRVGVAVLLGTALLGTLVAAVAAGPVLAVVTGSASPTLDGVAWLFAATGGCLALGQLLLAAAVAASDSRLARVAWPLAATEIAVVLLLDVSTVGALVTVALATALVLVVAGLLGERRALLRR